MIEWTQDGKKLSNNPPPTSLWGFVYRIDYTNSKSYIGKKQFWSVTKKKFGKRKLAEMTDQRAKKYEMVTKENDWRKYTGSSKETKGFVIEKKTILEVCHDKINLTYCEVKHLILNDVLVNDRFVNSNILGKFYVLRILKGKSPYNIARSLNEDN